MTNNKTASQLAKEAQKREAEKKCNATKNWESVKTCLIVFGAIFLAFFTGIGVSAAKFSDLMKLMPNNIITIVLVIGAFLFALARFFDTKKLGYGRFNSSTLIIILALMLAAIVLLVDKTKSEDVVKIIFAAIGFAAGMVTGKEASRDKKTTPPKNNKKNNKTNQ